MKYDGLWILQRCSKMKNHYVPTENTSFGHRRVVANQRCCNGSCGVIYTFSRSGFWNKKYKSQSVQIFIITIHTIIHNNWTITDRLNWCRINGHYNITIPTSISSSVLQKAWYRKRKHIRYLPRMPDCNIMSIGKKKNQTHPTHHQTHPTQIGRASCRERV